MSIKISELAQYLRIPALYLYSLENCIFQAAVEIDGELRFITDDGGELISARTEQLLLAKLSNLRIESLYLRHESAYDEMVGQPEKLAGNRLEVPLSMSLIPQSGD
jgi:hypothetical protein